MVSKFNHFNVYTVIDSKFLITEYIKVLSNHVVPEEFYNNIIIMNKIVTILH